VSVTERFESVVHGAQHTVFRVVSVAFSVVTAHSIYWFFSALNGIDPVQPYMTGLISFGFVVLGYFVTRGLAHRLLDKRSVWSYLLVGIPYLFVELVCNFGEALARYPDMRWIQMLPGSQSVLFSYLAPMVLSILPIFTVSLAAVDVDLMRERLGSLGSSLPKSASARSGISSYQPTAAYPFSSASSSSGQNGLKQHWNGKKNAKSNGASVAHTPPRGATGQQGDPYAVSSVLTSVMANASSDDTVVLDPASYIP
jgi:hypothetical protein